MNYIKRPGTSLRGPRSQGGAVLFVALMLLVILTLLGLASMQVTLLQERMAGNYRTANLAFQNAEAQIRTNEALFERAFSTGGSRAADQENCNQRFDVDAWARPTTLPTAPTVFTKRLDKCFTFGPRTGGLRENESTSNIYQISGISYDRATDQAALVVIETVYIP